LKTDTGSRKVSNMHSPGPSARKAPYASPSAFRDFLERTRNLPVPDRVDRNFLARLGIAKNNEWALTSALKFLNITDDRGVPTHEYSRIQEDDWRAVLRELVGSAYRRLLDHGGARMDADELRNYFRVASSPSQAQNAARFFREIRDLSRLGAGTPSTARMEKGPIQLSIMAETDGNGAASAPYVQDPAGVSGRGQLLLRAKLHALEMMPQRPPDWSADQYLALFDKLLDILRNLDESG
jgi:hypothetical protein